MEVSLEFLEFFFCVEMSNQSEHSPLPNQNRCEIVCYHSLIFIFQLPSWVWQQIFVFNFFLPTTNILIEWKSRPLIWHKMRHHTITWSSTSQITSVAPCCTRASVVTILRDSDRRIRMSLRVTRRNVIILHRARGSVMRDNQFSVQWVPGSFAGGKAARTRNWLFSCSWYIVKKSWNIIFIVTYACCASCFISRWKILPLSYLLFVFVIFMCCSTTQQKIVWILQT